MEQDSSPRLLGRRGLDPEQVDEALSAVLSQVEREEATRAEIDSRIDRVTRELNETRSALRRATAKPSFSDLGAAFEQTLRVAEEQAAKLLADAQVASREARSSAAEEAERITVAAEAQAKKTVADAEARVARLNEDAERKLSDQLATAQKQVELAEEQLAKASELAQVISAEGSQTRRLLEGELAAEAQTARDEIQTLRQLNEREQRRIADEIEQMRQRAERESARMAAETESYVQQLLKESQSQFDEASKRVRASLIEAQDQFAKDRQTGINMVREARETAQGILSRSRQRVETLNEKLDERTRVLLEAGEARVDELSFERESVEAFNSELRIISLAERISDDGGLPTTYTDAFTEADLDPSISLAAAVDAELASGEKGKG